MLIVTCESYLVWILQNTLTQVLIGSIVQPSPLEHFPSNFHGRCLEKGPISNSYRLSGSTYLFAIAALSTKDLEGKERAVLRSHFIFNDSFLHKGKGLNMQFSVKHRPGKGDTLSSVLNTIKKRKKSTPRKDPVYSKEGPRQPRKSVLQLREVKFRTEGGRFAPAAVLVNKRCCLTL